ncbi:MAG: T9SS type A sorting domain-containing protein [Saprospiraceae bacterium]|nr:T9SS type A sorting domain-containing protein [Saprospiraceae bacterium]
MLAAETKPGGYCKLMCDIKLQELLDLVCVKIILETTGSVRVKTFKFAKGQHFNFDLKDLPSGIYFVQVKAGTETIGFEKVVVAK